MKTQKNYKYSFTVAKSKTERYTPEHSTDAFFIGSIVRACQVCHEVAEKKGETFNHLSYSIDMTSPEGFTTNVITTKNIDVAFKVIGNIGFYNKRKKPKKFSQRFEHIPFGDSTDREFVRDIMIRDYRLQTN